MGKRSDFVKSPRDYYQTPLAAVEPLTRILPSVFTYIEPCAGDGRLIHHINTLVPGSFCCRSFDIEPDYPLYKGMVEDVQTKNALDITADDLMSPDGVEAEFIITNPPWSRDKRSGYLMHRMIETFVDLAPTWLLFDADWPHTVQAEPYVNEFLVCSMSIGRVRWIEGTTMSGKDNVCWYLFNKDAKSIRGDAPNFFGRNMAPTTQYLDAAA